MGNLWRRIDIRTKMSSSDVGTARAALEDDFHHFRVEVHAAHGKVDKVSYLLLVFFALTLLFLFSFDALIPV